MLRMKNLFRLTALAAAVLMLASCASSPTVVVTTGQGQPTPTPTAVSTPSPTPSPTPVPTPTPDPIRERIAQMSDEELVGQMVMIGFTGTADMDEESIALMEQYSVGNVLLFGWNTETFAQTDALIDAVNSHNPSDIPLLVGIDLEGGEVVRFKGQWDPSLLSAQSLGSRNDPQLTREQYARIGAQLKDIGIDIDFALRARHRARSFRDVPRQPHVRQRSRHRRAPRAGSCRGPA